MAFEPGQLASALDRAVDKFSSGTEASFSIDRTRLQPDGLRACERITTSDLFAQTRLVDVSIELMVHAGPVGYSLLLQGLGRWVLAHAQGPDGAVVRSVLDNLLVDLAAEKIGTLSDVLSTPALKAQQDFTLIALLHPLIIDASYRQFLNGHLREAVLNSMTALCDELRRRTGLQTDGDALIARALSLEDPYLVLSELNTVSGQNDQRGFMQILKGAFQGIRNTKAHSLVHDLTTGKAAQYLVFASLLARRIEEATVRKTDSTGTSGPPLKVCR